MTDADWDILEQLLPARATSGRRRAWLMRKIVNAIFYNLQGGVPWRLIPSHFPPWRTAYCWFARFRDHRARENINYVLVVQGRDRDGREASPTAAVIDSQSVKTTASGGSRGYDTDKKIRGSKRHAIVDTDCWALKLQVQSAAIQVRDCARPLLRASRARWPFVQIGCADGGYLGPRVANASLIHIQVVCRSDKQVGFVVLARRWVVERFFAWINRNRRLAKDVEASIVSAEAFLYAASSMLLLRRMAH